MIYRTWMFAEDVWYTFRIPKTDFGMVRDWCRESLPPLDWTCYGDSSEYVKFNVKGEQFREWFILRWS